MVLRDKLVRRWISLIDNRSRKNRRLTLAYIPMVITLDFLAEKFSRIGYFPGQYSMRIVAFKWSIFGARQQIKGKDRH